MTSSDPPVAEVLRSVLGLVASEVLRCNDCISYHVIRCVEEGVSDAEIQEALSVSLRTSLRVSPGGWRVADAHLTLRIPARVAALADLRGDLWRVGWNWWTVGFRPTLEFSGADWSARELDAPVSLDAPPDAMVEVRLPFTAARPAAASGPPVFRRRVLP